MNPILLIIIVIIFIVLIIYGCKLIFAGTSLDPNMRNILLGLIVILLAVGFAMMFGLFSGGSFPRLGG